MCGIACRKGIQAIPRGELSPCRQSDEIAHVQQGLTLLELLVATIILAVLSTGAVLAYSGTLEEQRRTEAFFMMDHIRKGELRFFDEHGFFADRISNLDIDDPSRLSKYFKYEISSTGDDNFLGYAIRQKTDGWSLSYRLEFDRRGIKKEVITGPRR